MRKLPPEDKYALLCELDPLMGSKTHRNDEKRITLFLERLLSSTATVSETYQQLTQELRTPHSIVFWLRNSNREELHAMLVSRIHKMLDRQGLTEIFAVYAYLDLRHRQLGVDLDVQQFEQYSGAGSSIGIREFKPLYESVRPLLLTLLAETLPLSPAPSYPALHAALLTLFPRIPINEGILTQCRDQLILNTKHYCKRQVRWIRNRIFVDSEANRSHFFVLDIAQGEPGTPLMDRFHRYAVDRAKQIVETVRREGLGAVREERAEFSRGGRVESLQEWRKYYCEACRLELNGQYNWNCHIESKKHQKQAKFVEKREEREAFIARQKEQAQLRK